jgi:putative endonuclease
VERRRSDLQGPTGSRSRLGYANRNSGPWTRTALGRTKRIRGEIIACATASPTSFPRKRESSIRMTRQPAVYILSNKKNGTLYIGVTSNLQKRVWEHKNNMVEGFTKRYGIHRLVYYELHENMTSAIQREKQMKKWNRAWKLELIEMKNPHWSDLWEGII